ncbi:MAG TPA: hypothetical protein VGQ83_40950 [Polyangia bacterium]|jgi:membrane protein implicated in regulation of membrane protease activity
MPPREAEPLPIWFFVGLILAVYGAIVLGAGLLMPPAHTVLAHLRPALWWGGTMLVAGAIFLAIGLVGRRGAAAAAPTDEAPEGRREQQG